MDHELTDADKADIERINQSSRLHGLYRAYINAAAAAEGSDYGYWVPEKEWLTLLAEIRRACL